MTIANVVTKEDVKRLCPTPHEEEDEDLEAENWWYDDANEGDEQEIVYDSSTGKELDASKVLESKTEELEFIENIPVYDVVREEECWTQTGKKRYQGSGCA